MKNIFTHRPFPRCLAAAFLVFFGTWTTATAQTEPAPPPNNNRTSHSGPRIGAVFFTGNIAERIKDPASRGGLQAKPIMTQFGYQFETTYMSNEKIQALFEFLPNVTGLDQGKFLPSMSILHGLRFNNVGWEIVVGPILYASKRAKGFFDPANDDKWVRLEDWRIDNATAAEPDGVITGLDTRGDFGLTTSFVFSVGKTFRSGNLNFPINVFTIPHSEGMRYGLSVGFNRQR